MGSIRKMNHTHTNGMRFGAKLSENMTGKKQKAIPMTNETARIKGVNLMENLCERVKKPKVPNRLVVRNKAGMMVANDQKYRKSFVS